MKLLDKFIDYLQIEKNYSKHTVTAYQKDIRDFLDFVVATFEEDSIIKVQTTYMRSWIVALKEAQLSNRSINRKITSIKTFYSFLIRIQELRSNPFEYQKSLKTKKEVIVPFSEREIEEAMLITDDDDIVYEQKRNKLMIHLLYASGIRQAELLNLKIEDVSISEKTIKVLGKRNKERIVPLYDAVVSEFKEYLEERLQVSSAENWFFVTKRGGKLYNALVYRVINSYFSKVTTKQKKSPHVLRHSYATDMVSNGADLNSVKELLGHSSLAATQIYTHNSLDKLKQVYNQAHPRSAKKK